MRDARAAFALILVALAAVGFVLSCSTEPADPRIALDGTIAEIIDGHTVMVETEGRARTIALYGVNSPEIDQRFGRFPVQFLEANLRGQSVQLIGPPGAANDFNAATVLDADGNDVQVQLLKLGLAWVADEDFPGKKQYLQEQEAAREQRLGIWAFTQHVPPGGLGEALTAGAGDLPAGRWRPIETRGTNDQTELTEELLSIGYLAGHDKATSEGGVSRYLEGQAQDGINLVVSGHGHEAILVDMHGETVHRWRYDWKQLKPDWVRPVEEYGLGHEFWRRVHPFENGDLLAIYENLGLVKIDRESNLIWAYIDTCHHDLDIDPRGHIFVLTRRLKAIESIAARGKVINDAITELSPDGTPLRTINIIDCFRNSSYSHELDRLDLVYDPTHVNSIQLLHESDGIFQQGRALISVRELDLLAVVDLDDESVDWTQSGPWVRQHDPELLENGNILLFDNLGHNGHSRVLEIDPKSGEITWAFAPLDSASFFTPDCGLSHRLSNGNTLCIESNRGRAIEVDPQGTIVWEYLNPHRAGQHKELVATLLDVIRLPRSFADAWTGPAPVAEGN